MKMHRDSRHVPASSSDRCGVLREDHRQGVMLTPPRAKLRGRALDGVFATNNYRSVNTLTANDSSDNTSPVPCSTARQHTPPKPRDAPLSCSPSPPAPRLPVRISDGARQGGGLLVLAGPGQHTDHRRQCLRPPIRGV